MSESINDVLIACIRACGGSKQVGPKLWPDKAPEAAQRLLLDCLNEDRPAHLTPDQVMFVLRMARDRGYHDGINGICETLSYSNPVPIEPKDELADLLRRSIEQNRETQKVHERIERLLQPTVTLRSA